MGSISNLTQELEQKVQELVVDSAKATLYDIVKYELSELAVKDPTFTELVDQAKRVLVSVETAMESLGSDRAKEITNSFKEYVEILESIGRSIIDQDNKFLTDNITHLEEFLTINGK